MNAQPIVKSKDIHVFIVDDSEIVRDRLHAILSEMGSVRIVGKADSPQRATEGILNTNPDVIILDIFLNGGNGITVLKDIRGKNITAKVIVLTNYAEDQYRKKCFEEGADYFFDKSIEFDKIIEVIERFSFAA